MYTGILKRSKTLYSPIPPLRTSSWCGHRAQRLCVVAYVPVVECI